MELLLIPVGIALVMVAIYVMYAIVLIPLLAMGQVAWWWERFRNRHKDEDAL